MNQNLVDLAAFREIVGSPYVKEDPDSLAGYAIDNMAPRAVILPEEVEEVSGVVRLAAEKGLSMVPRGSGSKIALGHSPTRLDLVIGMERLNRIVDMDTANLTVTAQAGVRFKEVQTILETQEDRCYLPHEEPEKVAEEAICSDRENRGCFIPLMPPFSETATLGGIIAANSSGPTRLLYGLPRDLVLGVRYVAPDGRVVGMGGKTVKNVSGYDMSKLMIGSMGTLGILCEMTLRLLPLPEQAGTGIFVFKDLAGARQFVEWIFETALLPAAVEVMNARAFGFLAPEGTAVSGSNAYAVVAVFEGVQEAVSRLESETEVRARELKGIHQTYLQVNTAIFHPDWRKTVRTSSR
ncbi:MAG: FAD-binding oxidoreductase [Deltaproteobacteria bacterium]|nr:FAD-binding oxidoreductase [Deltaproteobacteria bacterium]